jgi:hypothetical protein
MLVLAAALAPPLVRAQPAGAPFARATDSINARFILNELKKDGFVARLDTDSSGDPRISLKVDGYDWSIYFYACAAGDTEARPCVSYQFYSGYTSDKPVPLSVINKWNTEKRYARAYNYVQRDGKTSARIEIDVLAEGTSASRGDTFRAFFQKMKEAAQDFRKMIDFRG